MIAVTGLVPVTHLTGGQFDGAGQGNLMAAQPIGQHTVGKPTHWYAPSSSTCNRSYVLAAMRAGVIALVLLAILVLIVLT
jgi:hypothetical protein